MYSWGQTTHHTAYLQTVKNTKEQLRQHNSNLGSAGVNISASQTLSCLLIAGDIIAKPRFLGMTANDFFICQSRNLKSKYNSKTLKMVFLTSVNLKVSLFVTGSWQINILHFQLLFGCPIFILLFRIMMPMS